MGRITGGCCGSGSGGGFPTGTVGSLSYSEEDTVSVSGTTPAVLAEWALDQSLFTLGVSLSVSLACIAAVSAHTASLLVYVGGTIATVDGTARTLTSTVNTAGEALYSAAPLATFANPGTLVPIKLVGFTANGADTMTVRGISIAVYR